MCVFVWSCGAGDRYDSPNAYLHELSHNLGLYHAGTPNGCQVGASEYW